MSQAQSIPKLSVVVVSFSDLAVLERCLMSLQHQALEQDVEILVVRERDIGTARHDALRRRFPRMQWIVAASGSIVPHMRRMGLTLSRGEIVALLEDDCIVNATWCTAVVRAHQSSYIAIGGAVEPGNYVRGLDWGVYFCEYARFMRPFAGEVQMLPGNNVSYKRSALNELLQDAGDNARFYEVFVHRRLQQAGQLLKADPDLVVYNLNSRTLAHVLRVPFHHGRGFAGLRLAGQPLWRRLPFLGLALLLPLVQVGRIMRHVVARRRHHLRLVQALPWITLFALSWSVGEFLGYLRGAGTSLQQWRG